MSWLFCCGDQKQKQSEFRNTLDLSKPLPQESRLYQSPESHQHLLSEEDFVGLSGFQDDQSKELKNILELNKVQLENLQNSNATDNTNLKSSEKYGSPQFSQQSKIQGTSVRKNTEDSKNQSAQESLKFQNTQSDRTNKMMGNNQTKINQNQHSTSHQQKVVSDKKLSSYLQQAQKIINKNSKGPARNDQDAMKYSVTEATPSQQRIDTHDHSQNFSILNGPSPIGQKHIEQLSISHQKSIDPFQFDTGSLSQNKSKNMKSLQSSGLKGSRKQSESQSNLHINKSINIKQDHISNPHHHLQTQNDDIISQNKLHTVKEKSSNAKNTKNIDKIKIFTDDKSVPASDIDIEDQSANLHNSKIFPMTAKNENKKDNIFAINQQNIHQNNSSLKNTKNLNINTKLKSAQNSKILDSKTKVAIGTSRNINKNLNTVSHFKDDKQLKKELQSLTSSQLVSPTSIIKSKQNMNNTQTYMRHNLTAEQIENTLNQSNESQQKEIFPSMQSEFSFQPKYFKPQTSKNINLTQDISLNSATLPATRFFESVKKIDLSREFFIKAESGSQTDRNHSVIEKDFKKSLQTTPGYSASSTLIPNTRNPSIIPNQIQPSFLMAQQQINGKDQKNSLTKHLPSYAVVNPFNEAVIKEDSFAIRVEEDYES
eukprot:403364528